MYYSDEYIVVKGDITLEGDNNANKRNKLLTAFQKLMMYKLIMQKI